jgi:hypothetical protein
VPARDMNASPHDTGKHRVTDACHLVDDAHNLRTVARLVIVPDVEYDAVAADDGRPGIYNAGMTGTDKSLDTTSDELVKSICFCKSECSDMSRM